MTHAFCRACGNGVAPEARFCSGCGAPGNPPVMEARAAGTTYASYADVPWFRRRWFAVVCVLVFSPALVFLLATGDIYFEQDGHVRPIPPYGKYALIAIGVIAIVRVAMALFS